MEWECVSSLLLPKSKQLLILFKKKTYCRSTAAQVCSSAPTKVPHSPQHLLLMLQIDWIYYHFYYLTKIRAMRFKMTCWWCLERIWLWMMSWRNWLDNLSWLHSQDHMFLWNQDSSYSSCWCHLETELVYVPKNTVQPVPGCDSDPQGLPALLTQYTICL